MAISVTPKVYLLRVAQSHINYLDINWLITSPAVRSKTERDRDTNKHVSQKLQR